MEAIEQGFWADTTTGNDRIPLTIFMSIILHQEREYCVLPELVMILRTSDHGKHIPQLIVKFQLEWKMRAN